MSWLKGWGKQQILHREMSSSIELKICCVWLVWVWWRKGRTEMGWWGTQGWHQVYHIKVPVIVKLLRGVGLVEHCRMRVGWQERAVLVLLPTCQQYVLWCLFYIFHWFASVAALGIYCCTYSYSEWSISISRTDTQSKWTSRWSSCWVWFTTIQTPHNSTPAVTHESGHTLEDDSDQWLGHFEDSRSPPDPKIHELKIAQKFIDALKDALLDTMGLDPQSLGFYATLMRAQLRRTWLN